MTLLASRILTWTVRGGLALADQALYAGAHFVLNILLARWLSLREYGAFALVYAVFLLLSAVYSAVVLEPMIVFGSGRYRSSRRSYLGVLLRGHVAFTMPVGVALIMSGLVTATPDAQTVQNALLVLGVVTPVLLLALLTRRAFYLDLQLGSAATGNAIYATVLLGTTLWLYRSGMLSAATSFLAIAAAATAVGAVQAIQLRLTWAVGTDVGISEIVRSHWQYGRWALATAVAIWFPMNVYYLVLPAWIGLESAGQLKALMNLANPALHSLIASSFVIVPLLVRQHEEGGIRRMQRTVRHMASLLVSAAIIYALLLWIFRVELLKLVYVGKYLDHSSTSILLVSALLVVASVRTVFGSALRALRRPDRLFWAYATGIVLTLAVGLPMAASLNVTGALTGLLITYLASATAAATLCSAEGRAPALRAFADALRWEPTPRPPQSVADER